jgi:DNA-binding transcriptional MerR regulator
MNIGELARAADTKAETIRYYERIGLLAAPPRTAGNYRDYSSAHVSRLTFARRSRALGFSLCDRQDRAAPGFAQSREAVDVIAREHPCGCEAQIGRPRGIAAGTGRADWAMPSRHDCRVSHP